MKKTMRILLPVLLVIAIILCSIWYLLIYDRAFARDMLLSCARISDESGNHTLSTWFYNCAYDLTDNDSNSRDQVAIELAQQYKRSGNYTKAEYTLANAIADGGGVDLYIALCKTYVEQDKLYDAVNMLNNVTRPEIKAQLEQLRPAAPTMSPDSGLYNQYISVSISCESGSLYAATGNKYPSKKAPYIESIQLTDGENAVSALVISESGLVSQLISKNYTIGGVVKEVTFADSGVEKEVRKILNVESEKILYSSDLWKILEFTVPAGTQSYEDLQHMTFLTSLTLENSVAGDLTCIESMQNLTDLTIRNTTISKETVNAIGTLVYLKNLTLENCGLSNISALSNITAVENLNLSHNAISDITPLSGLKELKTLNLEHNVITACSSLSGLASLQTLDISNNVLTTIAPISGIASLTWIDANTNSIASLSDMTSLTALEHLDLSSNKLTNIVSLAACTGLVDLNISGNTITDISKLAALTNLMYLDFSNNQVSALPEFPVSCALVTINGSHNNISTLEPLGGLDHLNNVYMDYNAEISTIKPLARCYKLIEVHVYGTKVTNVTALTDMSVIVNYDPT